MGNALFIIWRESAEAMLVVGILYAWLKRQPDGHKGMRYLWGGVAAGVGLALVLAALMLGMMQWLSADSMEYFQLGMVTVAALLIMQMVLWMRRHGRTLKRDLEQGLQQNLETANWWGMLTVVALAVGRESAETVVFLYGVGLEQQSLASTLQVIAIGLLLASVTFWLLQKGGRWLSWQAFFRVSELLLLLLAGGLLVNAAEKMMNFGWLPPLIDPVWDSSALLDDSTSAGNFIATLTGYRAHPALSVLLAYLTYWLAMWGLMRRTNR
ncbi:high-affinity iron transporter [Chitinivorax tropicus]|uniref:High-affinity iron transporter n=1 Tax=Chitinivorax tropicus TaxID=714531 RepID=A0A840MP87_9PROT|nr:FTR1 family protein [Chitinivorax tropicus]MBB5017993.1 high-affinity iron transporter [Chitinivorax tropicus]